ncbi:MAG: class I mannose-6-phosphate isomerase [Candidatus Sumerlaeia bacterium]|nr:class I mannose-6-phosphate isomerase [Candidatus Sumerlaeia bacterium]
MSIDPDFFRKPLLMQPHFSERPWGGERLRTTLQKDLPTGGGPFGESWELSDHPDGRSLVAATGTPFGDLLRSHPREMIGRAHAPEKYPLLVKYIDAAGDLSVQVHPDDAWCERNNHPDRGKSECWYIMDVKEGGEVICGFLAGVRRDELQQALSEGKIASLLARVPINRGHFLAIPPGTVHAMLAGTLVCEIQQSSNTTFRLYDWDREPAREIHVEQSLQVSQFDPLKLPNMVQTTPVPGAFALKDIHETVLLQNEFFQVKMLDVSPDRNAVADAIPCSSGTILNVVLGSGTMQVDGDSFELKTGQTWYCPAKMTSIPELKAGRSGLRLLRTISLEI